MNPELQRRLDSQTYLYGLISRASENLRKLGLANITLGALDVRLQNLEANWAKFQTNRDWLMDNASERIAEQDYTRQNIPDLAEESFLKQKAVFLDSIRSLKAKELSAAASSPDTATPASRTTLPRIQLPHFSGKYEDWPAFRDLFQSILGRESFVSKIERMHYLKTCVKGDAELLIRNLSTTGENYERAWKSLSDYFENKRLLIRSYLANFTALQKMKNESVSELRKIYHCLKSTVNSLDSIGRPISSSEDLFVYLTVELLDTRSRREWENAISETTEPPAYQTLEQFLDRRLHTLESMLPGKIDNSSTKIGGGGSKPTRSHHARKMESKYDGKRGRCSLCQKDHFVMLCEEYKKKTAAERKQHVDANSLCLNCLGRHKVSECASKKDCTACGARHHSSLHDACREPDTIQTSHVAKKIAEPSITVLLATARVRVADRKGTSFARLWTRDRNLQLYQSTSLKTYGYRVQQVTVFGVGGQKTAVARGRVTFTLSPRVKGTVISASAIVLPRITVYSGGLDRRVHSWPHLLGLELADPDYHLNDPVDLLLGADIYAAILQPGLRKGGMREPVAQNTSLGWILSGVVGAAAPGNVMHTYQCRVSEDLVAAVRKFWEQEEVPSTNANFSQEDRECEEHFRRTHSRRPDGRYSVRLPIITPLPDLSTTRQTAVRALKRMEARFIRDESFHSLYQDFMRQYANLEHMTLISPANDSKNAVACYLPHHGVMREASSTTKLRVVFNGSSATPTGETLNRHLMIGPNLLPCLFDVLLRWRRHRFVLATDIEKMYRQIDVHEQDRDLQHIVWRDNREDEPKEYQLNTITYGLACAPFLAIRTLRQLADNDEAEAPLGSAVLRADVYMDDVLTGAPTRSVAKDIQGQLIRLCKAGGFPLKKWSSNDAALLEEIPTEDRLQRESRWWQSGESHATLGLRWHPNEDSFSFSTKLTRVETFSKRTVVSLAVRLFDPLGWLSPTTVRAKIFIQATWLLKMDWNAPLPEAEARRWKEFQEALPKLEDIRVPRWLTSDAADSELELHGFADASEKAYAAVVYLRNKRS